MNATPHEPPPPQPQSGAFAEAAPARPESVTDLFVSFTVLALQGFGGVLAIAQRELVEKKRWMTREQFLEEWAVAQILPGPNIINLALMLGDRYFGIRGAAAAVSGMLLLPTLVIIVLALIYGHFVDAPAMQGGLRGMGAVAAGLIAATGLKLASALKFHPLGRPLCIALVVLCFIAIALLRWPLLWVLLGMGLVSCVLTARKMKTRAEA